MHLFAVQFLHLTNPISLAIIIPLIRNPSLINKYSISNQEREASLHLTAFLQTFFLSSFHRPSLACPLEREGKKYVYTRKIHLKIPQIIGVSKGPLGSFHRAPKIWPVIKCFCFFSSYGEKIDFFLLFGILRSKFHLVLIYINEKQRFQH